MPDIFVWSKNLSTVYSIVLKDANDVVKVTVGMDTTDLILKYILRTSDKIVRGFLLVPALTGAITVKHVRHK